MAIRFVEVKEFTCERCGHVWRPREPGALNPRRCRSCHSLDLHAYAHAHTTYANLNPYAYTTSHSNAYYRCQNVRDVHKSDLWLHCSSTPGLDFER